MGILSLDNWSKDGRRLNLKYQATSKKWLEDKATNLHNEVEEINKTIIEGKYIINTLIKSRKNKKELSLKVKIKFYKNESEYECKKNTHRQEVNF